MREQTKMRKDKFNVLYETTVWETEYQPNFVYLERGNMIFAYIANGEKHYFKTPMMFNKKGRTFKTMVSNPFDMKRVVSF